MKSDYLNKNDRENFTNADIKENEKLTATNKLLTELAKGKKSAEEQGWLTQEDVERELELKWILMYFSFLAFNLKNPKLYLHNLFF